MIILFNTSYCRNLWKLYSPLIIPYAICIVITNKLVKTFDHHLIAVINFEDRQIFIVNLTFYYCHFCGYHNDHVYNFIVYILYTVVMYFTVYQLVLLNFLNCIHRSNYSISDSTL